MTATFTLEELQRLGYEKRGDQLVRVSVSSNRKAAGRSRSQDASPERKSQSAPSGGNAGWTPAADTHPRYRSKSEAAYAGRLHVEQRAGDIRDWRYECITLRLADRVRFTPDFWVWLKDGTVELHEVKGAFVREDARVKLQVAATMYPEFRFVLVRMKAGTVESFTTIRPLTGVAA